MGGRGYTWSNNHKDPTLEKLDRVLMSKEWESIFPKVWIYKLPRDFSDRNPLILATLCQKKVMVNEFKFKLSWLRQLEFYQRIKEIWKVPTRDIKVLDRVLFKIKKVKKSLNGWGIIFLVTEREEPRKFMKNWPLWSCWKSKVPYVICKLKRKLR
jgi:hypothetical protein